MNPRHALLALAFLSACAAPPNNTDAGNPTPPTRSMGDGGITLPDNCHGIALTADGVLELDLPTVSISGRVRLQGGQAWDASARHLNFIDVETQTSASVGLGADGAFRVVVTPGHYKVLLSSSDVCNSNVGPCSGAVLADNVALTGVGVLDLEVPVVAVQLQFSFNGTAASQTSSTGRLGSVVLTPENGSGGVTLPVSRAHALITVALVPGNYVASWTADESHCGAHSPPPLSVPCGTARLPGDVLHLSADGAVTVDIPSVNVQGRVTANGSNEPLDNGSALFFAAGTSGTSAPLTSGTPAQFSVTLVPGIYQVRYVAASGSCGGHDPWPCNSGTVMETVALTAAGQLDVDVPVAHVSGNVTVDGQPFPATSLGSVQLVNGDSALTVAVRRQGNATRYEATVLAGSYRVLHVPDEDGCASETTQCGAAVLAESVSLQRDGALDGNVRTVRLALRAQYQGRMLDLSQASPLVTLEGAQGLALRWDTNGQSRRVPPGRYSVRYDGGRCGNAGTLFPCGSAVLAQDVDVSVDGALDLNLDGAQVQYHLTLNGGPYPSAGGASLLWLSPNTTNQSATVQAVRGNGTLLLPQASYVVAWQPGDTCAALTSQGLPCTTRVLWGCE